MTSYQGYENLEMDGEDKITDIERNMVRIDGSQNITGQKTFESVIIHDLSVNSQTTFSTEDGIIHQLKDNTDNDLLDYGNYATYKDGTVKFKGLINKAGTDKFYVFHNQLNEPSISLNLNTQGLGSIVVREPTANNEVATKQYVESHGGGNYLPLSGGTLTGDLNMGNNDITNIENLTFDDTGLYNSITFPGANRLTFVDTDSNIFMHLNSLDSEQLVEIMKNVNVHGDITMLNSKRVFGLLNPISNDEPANKSYADTKLALTGGTLTGNLQLGANNIRCGGTLNNLFGSTQFTQIMGGNSNAFSVNQVSCLTNTDINLSNNGLINCDSISSGTQTLTSTNNILSTYENINVNSYLFETPNSQVCKLALKTQSSGFNNWIGKAMIDFQVDMAGIRDIPSGRIVSTPDFPQFVFQRAFMDFYNCWDFNPGGESGELLHMMRFSDIIRMYRNIDMSGNSIKNMSDGFDAGDAVNKSQLDTKLNLAGGSMTGNINMNTGVLRFGAGNITSTNIDGNAIFTRLTGGNGHTIVVNENQCEINTDLNMLTNKIVNVGSPSAGTDVANKAYVDSVVPQKYLNTFSLFVSANSAFSYGGFNFENIPEGSNGNRPFKIDMFSRFSYSASSDDLLSISADIAYLDSSGTQIGSTYSTGSAYNPSKTISTTRFITLHNQDIFQFPQGAVKCEVIIVINSTAAISKTGDIIVSINDINGL